MQQTEDTLARILAEKYSPRDVAFAVNSATFNTMRADLARPTGQHGNPALLLPQLSGRGKRGGTYRYGHVFELALHRYLAQTKTEVRSIFWSALKGNSPWALRAIEKLNRLPAADRRAVLAGGSFTREDDPWELSWWVDFAPLTFGADVLPRDSKNPLFWLVKLRHYVADEGDEGVMATLVELDGSTPLAATTERITQALCDGAADNETRAMLAEQRHATLLINVTDLLNTIDSRLALRLRARDLGAAE